MPTKASPPISKVPASLIAPHSLESVPWMSQYPLTTADTSCIKLCAGMIIDSFLFHLNNIKHKIRKKIERSK